MFLATLLARFLSIFCVVQLNGPRGCASTFSSPSSFTPLLWSFRRRSNHCRRGHRTRQFARRGVFVHDLFFFFFVSILSPSLSTIPSSSPKQPVQSIQPIQLKRHRERVHDRRLTHLLSPRRSGWDPRMVDRRRRRVVRDLLVISVREDVSRRGQDVGCGTLEEPAGTEREHGEKFERGCEWWEVVDIP